MLRVKGLTKKFGKKVANENVNLSLEAGEIGVLLGPNGAGKSTAIKCILGLLRFDGTVKIGGFPANSSKAKQILGYVPEFPCLYDMLTVREQFEFVVRAYKLDREKSRRYAAELVDRLRLTEVVDTLCKDLSKGMQQKVSIICALLPRPKLLLLDEPMLGLDPHAIKELRIIVQDLADEGVAVLISTHMIATVEGIWGKAYIMNKGKVVSCHRKEEMVGMWSESLERIFFAETESYDSQWRYDEDIRPSTAKAPAAHPASNPARKQTQAVSRPKTTKKKKGNKKKK
ncbi:MAG: ABC transporter ATP-binding protein [Clostridiales bacterium]|nr:ABC transporter ATP-binding protein [Clostridiales bacterium]